MERRSRFALSKMVGMDDKHRKLLRKKRMDLVRDMDGDRIASFLFSSEIFSEEDKDLVQAETTPQKKNEKLLDILPKRGGEAFDAFCNALRELGMSHLVVLLKSEDNMSSMIQSEKTAEEKSVIGEQVLDCNIYLFCPPLSGDF